MCENFCYPAAFVRRVDAETGSTLKANRWHRNSKRGKSVGSLPGLAMGHLVISHS
jgi:hypothetical protein